jgi:Zn-dependent protease with chaperone function
MAETLGAIDYSLAVELLLASALFWGMIVLVIRTFRIRDAAWRERFFLLPLLVPITVVPVIHLVIHPELLWFRHPVVEKLLEFSVHLSPITYLVFFSLAGLAALSCIGFCLLPLFVAINYRWIYKHQRQKSREWARCNRIAASVASRLQLPAPKIILTKKRTCSSLALGRTRSYVIVSEGLAALLDNEEMESLLAHELGHIKRHDTVLGTAAGVCVHLLTFSPFCHVAYRNFVRAREEAADDLAVQVSGLPLALASCLIKAYRFSNGRLRLVPGGAGLLSSKVVDDRISRLIGTGTFAPDPRSSRQTLAVFLAVIVQGVVLLMVFL